MSVLMKQDIPATKLDAASFLLVMILFVALYFIMGITTDKYVMAVMWVPGFMTVSLIHNSEKAAHFGAYAVCSHAMTRKEYARSKFIALMMTPIITAAIMAAATVVIGTNDLPAALSYILMTMMMSACGFASYMMIMFRVGMDRKDGIYYLFIFFLFTINLILPIFHPNNIAFPLLISALMIPALILCYILSIRYVQRMEL